MITLLIDTHYLDITLVLYQDGIVLKKSVKTTGLDHSMFIISMLEEILTSSNLTTDDIDEIIVVNGPGSFTGVRLGVTIGKTYAYLKELPLYAISYLEEMAVSYTSKDDVTPVIADKNGYYVATFDPKMELKDSYAYIPNHNFDSWKNQKNILEEISISYDKVYDYVKTHKNTIHPHELKPLYVKKFEVQQHG